MRNATKTAKTRIELPPKLEEESATERVQIVATERWVKRIDDWRRQHPALPNRSMAIRQLVEQALDMEQGNGE